LLVAWRPFFRAVTPKAADAHEGGPAMWIGPLVLAVAGVAAGLAPQALAQPLIEPAVTASRGAAAHVKLALWHGVNAPLVLSLTALALGLGLYLLREPLTAR